MGWEGLLSEKPNICCINFHMKRILGAHLEVRSWRSIFGAYGGNIVCSTEHLYLSIFARGAGKGELDKHRCIYTGRHHLFGIYMQISITGQTIYALEFL
jgi:hypothetical protein